MKSVILLDFFNILFFHRGFLLLLWEERSIFNNNMLNGLFSSHSFLQYFQPSGCLTVLDHAAKHISAPSVVSLEGVLAGISLPGPISSSNPGARWVVVPQCLHHLILFLSVGQDFNKCKPYSRSLWPP